MNDMIKREKQIMMLAQFGGCLADDVICLVTKDVRLSGLDKQTAIEVLQSVLGVDSSRAETLWESTTAECNLWFSVKKARAFALDDSWVSDAYQQMKGGRSIDEISGEFGVPVHAVEVVLPVEVVQCDLQN